MRFVRAALVALPVGESERNRLARYLDVLASWAARVNLTGAQGESERVELLIRPALAAARLALPGHLIDVGSGNGSPGLIIGLVRADVRVTLLEPRVRRWAFLREAARACGTPVTVLRQRHEQYEGEAADTLTARALRLTAEDARRLLKPHGRWVVFQKDAEAPPGFVQGPVESEGLQALDRITAGLFHGKPDGETT